MQPFTFFISYRRADTAPIALLLKYEIERKLQFVRVNVDVEEMRPGEQFPDRLKGLIDQAHVTIAIIGKQWMPRKGSFTELKENDWVVQEIAYSRSAPIKHSEPDKYGLTNRVIIPLFADCPETFNYFELPDAIKDFDKTHLKYIAYGNWPHSIGPLLDEIAALFDLHKRPEKDEYPTPDPGKARTQSVDDQELSKVLAYDDYDGWYIDNFGSAEVSYLVKTFKFKDFNEAADFMEMVANYCRIVDHHPEWRNVYNCVTVSLTSWDAKRKVTIFDLNLALYMNMAAKNISGRK